MTTAGTPRPQQDPSPATARRRGRDRPVATALPDGPGLVLDDLVRHLVDSVGGVVRASVDLGPPTPVVAASSQASGSVGILDRYQRELGDGPALRAARTRTTVHMGLEELDSAWPTLGGAAATAGVRSVLAVPVRLAGSAGSLTLYRSDDAPADTAARSGLERLVAEAARTATTHADADTAATPRAAEHAPAGVARAAAPTEDPAGAAARLRQQYSEALRWRAPIEQAKGILMAIHRIDDEAAFLLLRKQSQTSNRRLREVAASFVATTCGRPAGTPTAAAPTAPGASASDFRGAFTHAPVAMAITDLGGRLLEVNAALARLLAREPASLLGDTLLAHTHPDDLASMCAASAGLRSGTASETRLDARLVPAHGADVPVTVTTTALLDPHGREMHLAVHVTDRTAEERLRPGTQDDQLTGVPDRTPLPDRTSQPGAQHPVSVLSVDVVAPEAVADAQGRALGDAVLAGVAERLSATVRPADRVDRVGGAEFVVLCPDTTADDAHALARRLALTLRDPVVHDGTPHPVRVSIGTATGSGPGVVANLVQAADLVHAAALARCTVTDGGTPPRSATGPAASHEV